MKQKQTITIGKWLRNLLIIPTLLFIIIGLYMYSQYHKGLSLAEDGQYVNGGETFEPFYGDKSQFGEFNILLIGSDTRGDDRGNADTIMIAHFNPDSHDMRLASIMRDTYVDIPEHGKHKVNAAFALGGPELLRKTIKQNFDLDLQYYAVVDFEGFSKLVDILAPDGIEIDIPYEMSYGIGMTLPQGKQLLHGEELLGYVRFRHDRLSDFGRVERQLEVMSKLRDKVVSLDALVKLPKLLGAADPYIDTNVEATMLLAIGKEVLSGQLSEVKTIRIPLQDAYVDRQISGLSVLEIDIDKNKQALNDFLAESQNEKISEEYAAQDES